MHRNIPNIRREVEPPVELESQFILRLPLEPARILRDAIRNGAPNIKDRLSIKIDPDMRHGMVYFDNWMLTAKMVDLPTVLETMKTIDNKSFYKTADVCQMLLCKEEDDQTTTDDEQPSKVKKKDPNKVEKKYLWPHGITPPLKNVRKRRFRKTLKKKYTDAPEIEKEVKRLLRSDNDAVHVRWEVINEEDKDATGNVKEEVTIREGEVNITKINTDVAEHDIFGEVLTDSEEEESKINIMEMEENSRSRYSGDEMSDSNVASNMSTPQERTLVTQFTQEMFQAKSIFERESSSKTSKDFHVIATPKQEPLSDYKLDMLPARINMLQQQLAELRVQRQQQEAEIANTDNVALQHRFQEMLQSLITEQIEKEHELQELLTM